MISLKYIIFPGPGGSLTPPIDLGFALYTGNTPLGPKLYWRYLGFYFDHTLLFREHIRYYSTKALGMLGNSSRGVSVVHKHLLYWTCVVPVATYIWSSTMVPSGRTPEGVHQATVCSPMLSSIVDHGLLQDLACGEDGNLGRTAPDAPPAETPSGEQLCLHGHSWPLPPCQGGPWGPLDGVYSPGPLGAG